MAIPTNSLLPLTGDRFVDASTSGSYWVTGPQRTINWSISDGFNGEYWNAPDAVRDNVGQALNTIETYVDLDFQYTGHYATPAAAGSAGSDINVSVDGAGAIFSSSAQWGRGFFPDTYAPRPYDSAPGDVYLNLRSDANFLPRYS